MSRFCFTINNPSGLIDFESLPPWVTYVIYQEEVAPSSGTHHFQGYLEIEPSLRKRITTLVNDLKWDPAHFEVAKSVGSKNYKYCTKEESRVGGPYEYGLRRPDHVQGQRNDLNEVMEAIRHGASDMELFRDYPAVMARYRQFVSEFRVLAMQEMVETANFIARPGWQSELVDTLEGAVSERKIIWIYELEGNAGKSYFARNYRRKEAYYITGGRHSDIYHAYQSQKFVFFDVPRSAEDRFPYEVLEKFKDGIIFQSKYQSRVLYFTVPHVVVFANFAPDENKLSRDRWDIRYIGIRGIGEGNAI